jgi:ribose 5-phosphate isomerase RpiB
MKVGLVVEISQAFRVPIIEKILGEVGANYDHEVFNYTNENGTCGRVGLLNALLLNSGAVDFIVTGCGTGMGALVLSSGFTGVQCGFVGEPTDATMFREINMGNAVAMPFSKRYGNDGDLNLRYCFDKLLCPLDEAPYIGFEKKQEVIECKVEWDAIKKIAGRDFFEVLDMVDDKYLKEAVDSETFRRHFLRNCKVERISEIIKERLSL